MFALVSLLFVVISISVMTLESFSDFVKCDGDNETLSDTNSSVMFKPNSIIYIDNSSTQSLTTSSTETIITDNSDLFETGHFSVCKNKLALQWMELLTLCWFTIETALRLITCPSWKRFFTSPLNLIDLVSTVPFYIEMILVAITNDNER